MDEHDEEHDAAVTNPPAAAVEAPEEVLFAEHGASWLWLLGGPIAALAMLTIELSSGYGPQPLVPLVFLVLVTSFVALQVVAARMHTSVALTATTLRQGTESIGLDEILRVYPEAENTVRSGKETEVWQSARALGELMGVPRGRIGIGLQLVEKRTAQAWARRHRMLRAKLTQLVDDRDRRRLDSDSDGAP